MKHRFIARLQAAAVFLLLVFLGAAALLLFVEVDLTGPPETWWTQLLAKIDLARLRALSLSIARGLAIAVLLFFLTQLIQRTLRRRFDAMARVDAGVRDAVVSIAGYIGFGIAAFAGLSAAGVNLSSLALVAGALSVGIGFGLQNIANDFVSGLLLLVQRPIKAGDWVVTASGEGTVKQIGARATEIETFDKASLIVPNSQLLSSTITNWTHRDQIVRITISVGVSYDTEPEKIAPLLVGAVRGHDDVLAFPEPYAWFRSFGDSALDFGLRVYIMTTSNRFRVENELRVAIFKALKEAGVTIPFPQRDIHIIDHKRAGAAPGADPEDIRQANRDLGFDPD